MHTSCTASSYLQDLFLALVIWVRVQKIVKKPVVQVGSGLIWVKSMWGFVDLHGWGSKPEDGLVCNIKQINQPCRKSLSRKCKYYWLNV